MKKFIAVLALAGSLAACNSAGDGAEAQKDSIDAAASDVKDRLDSTGAAGTNVVEAEKDKIDSSAEAKKDSVSGAH
jgi:PBP1b-binding outer membrane lipoprotein LpoB